ncbi:hypothetical protein ACFLYT_01930 [Nanoarchaeota archaeon]
MFDIESNITFANYTFTYNYSSLEHTLTDEEQLKIWKCDNFSSCLLVDQAGTVNTSANLISMDATSLSRLMVTEPTVIDTVTITRSSSSSSTRLVEVNKTKKVSLKFIPTSPLTIYSKDNVTAKIVAINTGEVDFTRIDIDIISGSEDISVRPTEDLIEGLKVGDKTSFDVHIESHTAPGIYEVNIMGISEDPNYTEEAKIIINLIEREIEVNRTKVIEKVEFAYDLFKENPECIEYQDLVTQANKAIEREEFPKAGSLLESAINACKETITSLRLESPGLIRSLKSKRNVWFYIAIIVGFTMTMLFIMEFTFRKAREHIIKNQATKKKWNLFSKKPRKKVTKKVENVWDKKR